MRGTVARAHRMRRCDRQMAAAKQASMIAPLTEGVASSLANDPEARMQFAICAALVICGLALPANAQQSETPAANVGTIKAERRPIEKTLDFVGRVEAINRVEIRARVKGYLEAVLFEEGGKVKEGDPLYHIEKDQFQAQVEQAQGVLERSKAALILATLQRQRAQQLLDKNVGTVVARDEAVAQEGEAKGAVLTAEANLLTANINLRYTDIVSPIGG